jgi:hypothetical protein
MEKKINLSSEHTGKTNNLDSPSISSMFNQKCFEVISKTIKLNCKSNLEVQGTFGRLLMALLCIGVLIAQMLRGLGRSCFLIPVASSKNLVPSIWPEKSRSVEGFAS